jgi:hypothetical protein
VVSIAMTPMRSTKIPNVSAHAAFAHPAASHAEHARKRVRVSSLDRLREVGERRVPPPVVDAVDRHLPRRVVMR